MAKREKKSKPTARAKAKYTIYNVNEQAELMTFLMEKMQGISRNTVKSYLTNRRILVDNKITTQYNYPLKPGMKIQISSKKNNKEFRSSLIKLLYEDAYLLIIEKKYNLLAISTDKQKERSAHSILMEYVKRSAKEYKVFPVHRLDKEASGLMIFAKDEKTKNTLQKYWHEIIINYKFVAVLSGEMKKDNGSITSWIQDDQVFISHSPVGGNEFEKTTTYYKTIKRRNGYSLVELEPDHHNGRKNQIHAHMSDLNCPIIGDEKYGSKVNPLDRMGLHAFELHFYHPITGEKMMFDIPYPTNFKKLLLPQQETQA